jgi:hypothetical protein
MEDLFDLGIQKHKKCKVFVVGTVKNAVLWEEMLCGTCYDRCFRG